MSAAQHHVCPEELVSYLQAQTEAAVPCGAIHTLDSIQSLDSAFHQLQEFKLRAAPVYDSDLKQYVGFLSTSEIAKLVILYFHDSQHHHHHAVKDMRTAVQMAAGLFSTTVKQVVALQQKHSFAPVGPGCSLIDIIHMLARLHRVPVVDPKTHSITNVVTQSTIIRLLNSHPEVLGELGNKTIAELNLGSRRVISVNIDDKTVDAFKTLVDSKVQAVAVVDEQGILTANLSLTDVRNVASPQAITYLNGPVSQFINYVHHNDFNTKYPSVATRDTATFKQLIARMTAAGIHRIYLEDEMKKPIGVISMSDIMRFLSSNLPGSASRAH